MKPRIYLICDYRESFNNNDTQFSDHYSLASINKIIETIASLGYECKYFGGVGKLLSVINDGNYDVEGLYLNFNDGINSISKRGQTPILLEMMGVDYSGSSPLTHLIVSNKYYTNEFLKGKIKNLNIPPSKLISSINDVCKMNLSYPIIIKPNDEGSSLGIDNNSICSDVNSAQKQFKKIKHFKRILAQEFINGYELTNYFIRKENGELLFNEVILIGKDNSPQMDNKLFTSNDKFNHKRTYYDPNEYIGVDMVKKTKEITKQISNKLDIITLGRIDYKCYNDELYFIEANTVPAFSITSDIGEICKLYHYSFDNIVKLLLDSLIQ